MMEREIRAIPVPPKISELVVRAIESLDEKKGSTCEEIVHFIVEEYDVIPSKANRLVALALKRGIENGNIRQEKKRFRIVVGGVDATEIGPLLPLE